MMPPNGMPPPEMQPPVPTQSPMPGQGLAQQNMMAQPDPNMLAQLLMAQGQGQMSGGATSNADRQFMQGQMSGQQIDPSTGLPPRGYPSPQDLGMPSPQPPGPPMMGPGGPAGALRRY